MSRYQELKVWQLGMEMAIEIYRLTEAFRGHEIYGLTSQLRRAVVSIPSNVAEGHTRGSARDMIRFVNIARGSLAEVETQLMIARALHYGDTTTIDQLLSMASEEGRMLSGLRRSLQRKLK